MLIDQGSRVCSSRKEKALAEIELSHKSSKQVPAYGIYGKNGSQSENAQ